MLRSTNFCLSVLVGNPEGKRALGRSGIDERIILE
jgi:hypothetical protein